MSAFAAVLRIGAAGCTDAERGFVVEGRAGEADDDGDVSVHPDGQPAISPIAKRPNVNGMAFQVSFGIPRSFFRRDRQRSNRSQRGEIIAYKARKWDAKPMVVSRRNATESPSRNFDSPGAVASRRRGDPV
jgi:hypothetical protein